MNLFRRGFKRFEEPKNRSKKRIKKKGGLFLNLSKQSHQPLLAFEDSSGLSPQKKQQWDRIAHYEEDELSILQSFNKKHGRDTQTKKNKTSKKEGGFIVDSQIQQRNLDDIENTPQWMTFENNSSLFSNRKEIKNKASEEPTEPATIQANDTEITQALSSTSSSDVKDDLEMDLVEKILSEDRDDTSVNPPDKRRDKYESPEESIVPIEDILKPQNSSEFGDEGHYIKDDDEISFSDRAQERKAIEVFMEKNHLAGPPKKDTDPIFNKKEGSRSSIKDERKRKQKGSDQDELEFAYSESDSESGVEPKTNRAVEKSLEEHDTVQDKKKIPKDAIFDNTTEIMSEVHDPSSGHGYVSLSTMTPKKADEVENEDWNDVSSKPAVDPLGSTKEEISMLNRFLQVVGPDFDGNDISIKDRIDIYNKASRAGLSKVFVDKMLDRSEGLITTSAQDDDVSAFSDVSPCSKPLSMGLSSNDHSTYTRDTESISYYTLPRTSPSKYTEIEYNCNNTFNQYFWTESANTGHQIFKTMKAVVSHDSQSVHSECAEA